MSPWFMYGVAFALTALAFTGAFFFATTRGTLLVRSMRSGPRSAASHVYPIYSNMRLMRLVDFQPVIAAILLFQYDRLVSIITGAMRRMDLRGHGVLITSCAFGNVMPRIVRAGRAAGARQLQVVDIIENELIHARRKLHDVAPEVTYRRRDATSLDLPDGSVDANVLFFLLHELPHDVKRQVLDEAWRVVAPGGKLFLAEFHRPRVRVLRALSWLYFTVFEPWGLALWSTHDPMAHLQGMPGVQRVDRTTVCFGNYQVLVATKG